MSVTPKQARFVEEYLVDLNATQAAIRAGYSAKTAEQQGPRLLGNVGVAAAIAAAQSDRAKRVAVDQDYVLASIVSTVERCKQVEPVLDRQGNPVMIETPDGEVAPAFTFNAMGVFRGAELLGRHLGMFTDRVEHTGKDGAPIAHEHIHTLAPDAAAALDAIAGRLAGGAGSADVAGDGEA